MSNIVNKYGVCSFVNKHRGLQRRDSVFRDWEGLFGYESDDCIVRTLKAFNLSYPSQHSHSHRP